jgi:hypothetical protein
MKIKVNGVEVETDGNYKLGYTMCTPKTKKWSEQELAENNAIEEKIIYANFNSDDQGKSKIKICECQTAGQAINVLTALRTSILETKFELAETIHKLISTHELGEQSNSMLQIVIDTMVAADMDSSEWAELQALLDARSVLEDITFEWKKANK